MRSTLKRWWTATGLAIVLAIIAVAANSALAGGSPPMKKHTKATPTHHSRLASSTTSTRSHSRAIAAKSADPDEQNSENESTGNTEGDGVEQAGNADHQCPPDCAPGENP